MNTSMSPLSFSRRQVLRSAGAAFAALPFSAGAAAPPAFEKTLTSGWEYYRGQLGSAWEVWRYSKASDNVAWNKVTLPHCFNMLDCVDPDRGYYQGPGWYRTMVKVENPFPGGRTLLCFEGAGQKTEVYVFTTRVERHVGGYDEWEVDITDSLSKVPKDAPKEIKGTPIAVYCDNSRDAGMIPSSLSDFNLYGGLYRKVHLLYVPAVSLDRVHIEPKLESGKPGEMEVRARLRNPANLRVQVEVALSVKDPADREIHAATRKLDAWPDATSLANFSVPAPALWSPDRPSLYRCEVTLKSSHGESSSTERFGFRFFEWVEKGPFKLNGQRLLLRGTHRHEDHAGLAAALTDDLIRREMRMIKDVGANFIRLGHYQQSKLVLDLCDELGLLVWEEIPWCRGGVGGQEYRAQARRMLTNMIGQHYNHPSVILWGLGNENDWPGDFEEFDQKKIRAFMSELNELAHRLDPSRKTAIRRCDFCRDIPDVYSPSVWAGWYRGRYTEYRGSVETEMKSVKHMFHAEWGGDSHAGRHAEDPDKIIAKIGAGQGTDERGLDYLLTGGQTRASRDGDWSETYICNLFDWHLKEQETMPWLTGAAQWVFKDFSTPLRPENPVPRMNQKGLVERDLTPKEAYYVFQSYWAEEPMARIYGHSMPVRWGEKDEPKMVKVYSNCPEAELLVNGVSQGVKKRNSQDFPAAGLRWQVKFKEGENRLRVVAKRDGATAADEITQHYQTAKWGKPAKLELKEIRREGDRVTVEASLSDDRGVLCLDARNAVRFALAGDGRLLDNLGTSSGSSKVELCNGRARISLLLNGGRSVVGLSAEGIPSVFLTAA
jgi:beta-galactosidase